MKFKTKSERISEFHAEIRSMGYSSYSEYLRSDHWLETKRRFRASKLYKHKCSACGNDQSPMFIHHKTYKRIGRERLNDLIEVCGSCHSAIHKHENHSGRHLWQATNKVIRKTRKGLWRGP